MSDKQEPARSDASPRKEPENGAEGKGPAGPDLLKASAVPLPTDGETAAGTQSRAAAAIEIWKTKPGRLWTDNVARHVVTVGGVLIIACILAILIVIIAECLPLFYSASAKSLGGMDSGARSEARVVMVDEHRTWTFIYGADGARFLSLENGEVRQAELPEALGEAQFASASRMRHGSFAVGLSDGRILPADVHFTVSFDDELRRTVTPDLSWGEPMEIDPDGRPVTRVLYVPLSEGVLAAGVVGENQVVVATVVEEEDFMGNVKREVDVTPLSLPVDGEVTALEADSRHENLYVGTSTGQVIRVSLFYGEETPEVAEEVLGSGERNQAVTMLGMLVGDVTLIVGDAGGDVTSWQNVRAEGGWRLTQMHAFGSHKSAVTTFAASSRNKGFFTGDASGNVELHYNTTGKTLLQLAVDGGEKVTAIAYPEKGDGVLIASGATARLSRWDIDNEHPEATWKSLFGEIWYEGYEAPDYVWQSSSGTDDFEPKFGLTPLIVGTLKGTLYAMLFAVPIALMGALYASQFMHPSLKGYMKPAVEIMAGLPSVVLGFLAGLWLAPLMETIAPGVFLSMLVFPVFIFLALLLWNRLPLKFRMRVRPGAELVLLVPVVVIAGWASIALGRWMELGFLHGDFRAWALETLGMTYDQRNSLVVGIAMGFAVIPIIFTIAEDSLTNVPPHLRAGSLALGATRWQTALKVVLPTASPGIFSAIMIGLGRAVGETMIVLMATGNTPVMDWSIFSGFRALSANIAVELPEAPHASTHYRVLFLAALLLFIMTFIVNTGAEMIRLRLRKKYQAYA